MGSSWRRVTQASSSSINMLLAFRLNLAIDTGLEAVIVFVFVLYVINKGNNLNVVPALS